MKKILILLILIGVVLISGCVGQTQTSQTGTNGLIISDFSPDPTIVMAGDPANLNFELQNVGDAVAKNMKVELYGVTFGNGSFDWGITEGSQSFSFDDQGITQLLPPTQDISGETTPPYVWGLTSPKGIKSDTTYSFDVRTEYDYSTDVTGILTFVSKGYWESLSKSEKDALTSKAGISQLKQTGGPISVTIYAGQRTTPFVIYSGQNKYTMRVNPNSVSNKQDFTISLSFQYRWRLDSSTDITVQKPLT
ncbi:MAG: hypothetical protein NTW30_03495 [Candidatus Aenigmarchaeota archaeon]|nr:hypothetical protein [Candidatus Aenigmarchaeota archaeon]